MELTSTLLGTPYYMSPEQASGNSNQLTTASDVFSIGAMLYQILTGELPFRGENAIEIRRKVSEERPSPPSTHNPQLDRDLETICLKCIEKEPSGRYTSAREIAQDLQRWINHEPIRARPIRPWERVSNGRVAAPASPPCWARLSPS